MKKLSFVLVLAVLFSNCNKNKTVENPPLAPTEIAVDTIITPKMATSKNSLDYLGMYKGKLPCADCIGIETTLELSEDFSYFMTLNYLGKSNKTFEQKGTFAWNKAGNAIILNSSGEAATQYLIGENTLTQLDGDGNKITGELAPMFILKKLTESQAAKTNAMPQKSILADLTGMRWKIDALNGNLVKNDGEKEFYMEFNKDGDFSAFAGCNRMGGHYEINKSRIKFLRVMSTMMACPEMKLEDQLKTALETADNFVANEKILQFRKGGTTLVEFDAVPLKAKK